MAKKRSAAQPKPASRLLTAEDRDFVRQILADPDDDAPRLAYADWMEKQGDRTRANFIRRQIEGARARPKDPPWKQGGDRAAQLLREHEAEWTRLPPELAQVARVSTFERGFPSHARVSITDFREDVAPHLPVLWEVAPITSLELLEYNAGSGDIDFHEGWLPVASYSALARFPQLTHIRSLSVAECGIKDKHLKALLASPHLTDLRELHLSGNRMWDTGPRVVAGWPRAKTLAHLDLSESSVGDRGAEALAKSPYLKNLKTLDLQVNRVGEAGGLAIARSRSLANLETLNLRANNLGAAAEAALRERFGQRVIL